MAYPPYYDRKHPFTDWQAEHPSSPLPADWLEEELNSAKTSIDAAVDSLKLIQRSDGALGNRTVGLDQLKPEVRVGIRTPSVWAPAVAYRQYDCVGVGAAFYVATVDHTSSSSFTVDYGTGKWAVILDFSDVATEATEARDEAVAASASAQVARTASEAAASAASAHKDSAAVSAALAEGYKNGTLRPITFNFDGAGGTISPGFWGFQPLPGVAGRITSAMIVANETGSMVLDIWRSSWADAPPTASDSICGTSKLTISSATKVFDDSLAGWVTTFSDRDVLGFNIDSVSNIKFATLALTISLT